MPRPPKTLSIDIVVVTILHMFVVFQQVSFNKVVTMRPIHYWYEHLDMAAFAERLRLLRQARNITQARLAELLGINPRAYNRWETADNVPHLDTLIKIADILQISLDELAGRKEPSGEVKIRNYELHRLCQEVDNLSDEDQKALVLVMDGLVKKTQMTKVMGQAAKG